MPVLRFRAETCLYLSVDPSDYRINIKSQIITCDSFQHVLPYVLGHKKNKKLVEIESMFLSTTQQDKTAILG